MGVSAQMGIKSIQRLVMTFPPTGYGAVATISAVNTSKTQIRLIGVTGDQNSNPSDFARVWLTDATTVSATRAGYSGGTNLTVEITEWY